MTVCDKKHRFEPSFEALPEDQGGEGRHKCAGCAYELGFEAGRALATEMTLDLGSLLESQAGTVRHKSPHAAWALGYLNGVKAHYAE